MTDNYKILKELHENSDYYMAQISKPDKHGGWICPICGSGSGKHGTGLTKSKKDPGRYTCWSNGNCFGKTTQSNSSYGDIVDIIASMYGISNRSEAIKEAARKFNLILPEENKTVSTSSENKKKTERARVSVRSQSSVPNHDITNSDEDIKNIIDAIKSDKGKYSEFKQKSQEYLKKSKTARNYLRERGISLKTALEFDFGSWKSLTTGGLEFNDPVIIFSGNEGYAVRNTKTNISGDRRFRKSSGNIDIPTGLIRIIKEPDKKLPKSNLFDPVFIVEGYMDAPSLYEAGADAVALNGIGNIEKIIACFQEFGVKRPVILALDNDKTGIKNQEINYQKLKESGIQTYKVNPEEFYKNAKDANEYLKNNKKGLKTAVEEAKQCFIQDYSQMFNIGQFSAFKSYLNDSTNYESIPTGFSQLDSSECLDGGLHTGVYIVGAESSIGKSAFTLQMADNIAKSGREVLFISLEMSGNELRSRSVSRYTYILSDFDENNAKTVRGIMDRSRYFKYSEDEVDLIERSIDKYFQDTGNTLRIVEGMGDIDIAEIEKLINYHVKFTGEAPIVIIDYLQLIIPPKDDSRTMNEKQTVDYNISSLKHLSKKYKIPIIAVSSFNRTSYGQEAGFGSFKESGLVEYSADSLITLEKYNPEKNSKEITENRETKTGLKNLKLKVLKSRNGPSGGKVYYRFNAKFSYFYEVSKEELQQEYKKLKKEIIDFRRPKILID